MSLTLNENTGIPGGERISKLDSLVALKQTTLELCRSATKKIQFYTHNLDPRVLNDRELETILKNFFRLSRFVQLQLLIKDEDVLKGLDHRLVALAQNFTSYASIRIIPKDFHENLFAFYLIDARHMIYRSNTEKFESELHQLPSSKLVQMDKYFDEVWQQSSPATHLRALYI